LNYCRCHCTHLNYTWWGCCIPPSPPPWCSSAIIGAPQSQSALLSLEWHFDISFCTPYCLVSRCFSSRMRAPQSPPRPRIGAPLFHSRLVTSLPLQRWSTQLGCSAGYVLLNPCRRSLACIFTPQFHSALHHRHPHCPCPPRTLHQALHLSWRRTSFSPEFVIFASQTPL
jgi:hypothetical protein